ncbi:MAG: DUF1990 domain-containing protein [Chloroflexota bacterium]
MYFYHKPTSEKIEQLLQTKNQQPFSYREVGTTEKQILKGYVVDHNRIQLGHGSDVFDQAKAALRNWEMFNLGWVELCWPQAPLTVGTTVGVLVHGLGIWSLNFCRIVYVVEETTGPIERFGFAYGTLLEHAERGEERFTVEWNREDDTVWYDILAFSQPNQLLAKLGYPYVRRLQKRFATDSKQAMHQATNHP